MTDSTEQFHPSKIFPDLTDERMQFLASLFVDCRRGALQKHDPEAGEDAWCLGCRSYSRICAAISRVARDDQQSWLTVVQDRVPGRQFIFRIGTVPFRFYTGNPSRPTARTLRIDSSELNELKQIQLPVVDGSSESSWFWRLAIGVTATGEVGQVCVLQVTQAGSVRNVYSVPFEGAVRLDDPTVLLPPAIELDSPEVSLDDEDQNDGTGQVGSGHAR